jgi:cytochrome c oxidase subunit 2
MRLHLRSSFWSILVLHLGGCSPAEEGETALMWIQSTLVPRGPHAEIVATLGGVMVGGAAAIFILVVALTVLAIVLRPERRRWMTSRRFIVWLGIVFPVVTLTALLVYGLWISRDILRPGAPVLRVQVIGERWWWRVRYLDRDGSVRLVSANEIRVPTGRPVEFVLETQDVIHSFWVPNLAGKLDMIPGRRNVYRFAVDRPGIYRGQCAEYCGAQHALMAFYVIADEPAGFEAWYAREARAAHDPVLPLLTRGKELFLQNGCGACHTIRGTPADGVIGPDLTHVGSRRSIAAGTFPTNVGTLAGWISSAQHLKPDNLMPSFGNLQGEELRAIAAYLESLK